MARPQPSTVQPPHGALPARGLWLALGVLAALLPQAGLATHAAFARHVRCPVHGELMHLAHHGDASADMSEPAPVGVHERHGENHDHEHCQAWMLRAGLTLSADSRLAVALPAPLQLSLLAPCAGALGSIAVLSLSPKTSPPVNA